MSEEDTNWKNSSLPCKPRQKEKVWIRIAITAGKWKTAMADLMSSFSEKLFSVSAGGTFESHL